MSDPREVETVAVLSPEEEWGVASISVPGRSRPSCVGKEAVASSEASTVHCGQCVNQALIQLLLLRHSPAAQ
jgi:hypothetical protein